MAGGLRSAMQQHEMAERGANSSSRRIPEENDTVRSKLTDTHISICEFLPCPSKVHIGVAVINKPSSKLSRPSRTSTSAQDLPSRSHTGHGREMAPDAGGV